MSMRLKNNTELKYWYLASKFCVKFHIQNSIDFLTSWYLSDFLELKKAYIGNEQQLVEMQEPYLFLQQSYQDLQRNSQDQQAILLENLEKSYDAFNEKFMRVEELEEKLNKRNENVEKTKKQNEDKVIIRPIIKIIRPARFSCSRVATSALSIRSCRALLSWASGSSDWVTTLCVIRH